jgi:predicted permease
MKAWTSGWLRELTVAVRSLLRAPAYTAVAVATLAMGLGGTAAIYALLDRVVLDPLPYPEAERLVQLRNHVPGVGPDERWHMSQAQYVFLSDRSESLEVVGLYRVGSANLLTPSAPERVRRSVVTADVLPMLGARAHLGRVITPEDDAPDSPLVVVLSHGFWQRVLGGDPEVVGRTLTLDDHPFEVIGVLEPGVEIPGAPPGSSTDVWTPMRVDRAGYFGNTHVYPMLARLAPGADPAAAEAELARSRAQLPEAFPDAYSQGFFDRYGFRTLVLPLKGEVVGDMARNLWIVSGAVGLLLLITCANVANLFLVRMEARRRELAIRAALGAGRAQVARYLLAEGLSLAGSGAALALLVSHWSVPALSALTPLGLSRVQQLSLDGGTVLFTLALAGVVGFGLSLHPLLMHARGGAAPILAEEGRGGSGGVRSGRFRSALVVTQVAMALVLVVSAGLLADSMRKLMRVDPGFEPDGVLALQINLTQVRYPDEHTLWTFYDRLLEGVRALPGVVEAGLSAELPLLGGYGCTVQGFEDPAVRERLQAAGMTTCAGQEPTTPGFFEAMGIPVLRGRGFERADNDDPARAAVVVSQAFADRFWPGEDPIGKRVAPNGRSRAYHTVVGVVGDVPAATLDGERAIAVYYPITQEPTAGQYWWAGAMHLVVKTERADPATMLPAVREVVRALDPGVPLANAREMKAVIDASMARLSFTALLLAVAAGTALLLAAIGLYGVMSYAVTRRTREIGMRIAIGARPGQVERMVVAQSLGLATIGLLIGVAGALAGTRVLTGLLYEVEPTEPRAFLGSAALLLGVALLASWIPARRAARVDPSEALREA